MIRSTKLSLLATVSVFALVLGAAPAQAQSVVVNGSNRTTAVTLGGDAGTGETLTFTSANAVILNNSSVAVVTISSADDEINTANAAATAITTTGTFTGPAVINITSGGTAADINNNEIITEAAGVNAPVIQSNAYFALSNNDGATITSNSTGPVINLLGGSTNDQLYNSGTISNTGSGTAFTMANGASGFISNVGIITGTIDNSANSTGAFTFYLGSGSTTGAIKLGSGGDVVDIGENVNSVLGTVTSVGAITGGTGSTGTVNIVDTFTTSATIGAGTSVGALKIFDGITFTADNNVSATAITIGSANTTAATLAIGNATVTGTVNSDGAGNLGKLVAAGASVVNGVIGGLHALATITVDDGDSLTTNANVTAGAITLGSANATGGTLTLGGTSVVAGTINSDGVGNHGILVIAGNVDTTGVIGGIHGLASITVDDGDALTTTGNVTAAAITLGSANATGGTLTLGGTGTVSGTINSDGIGDHGILAITGDITTAGIIGATHGLASITVDNGGTLIFDNNITSTATTVATGGTLTVGANNKTVAGTLANNGTLNIGANTVTVTGNVTGASGKIDLTVGNTAATTGEIVSTSATGPVLTTALTVTPTLSNTVIETGNKVILFKDTAATATLPAASVTSTSLLTSWAASVANAAATDRYGNPITAGDIVLTASSVNAATIAGVNPRLASAVNGLTAYTGSDANMLSLLSAAQGLTSSAQINQAGEQLGPDANGVVQETAFSVVNQALSAVASRNNDLRMAQTAQRGFASGEALAGYGFWAQGFGFTGNQGTIDGIDGYNSTTFGTALGGDARILRNSRAGASFVFANSSVDDSGYRSGSGLTANSYVGTLYGTYTGTPWYIDANIAVGAQNFDSTRLINFSGAPVQIAKGSFNTQQYGFSTEFGYPFQFTPKAIITPVASFGYTYLNQDGYTESGAPGADLAVGGSNTYSARAGLGAKFAASLDAFDGWTFKPNAQLIWQHEFNPSAPDQTSSFIAAGGTSFTTEGIRLPQDAAIIGIGMDLLSQDDWTVSAKYDVELREQYFGEGGLLQIRKDF